MRLIDADTLIKEVNENKELFENERVYLEGLLLNAPTVPLPDFKEGYKQAILDGETNFSRQKGEREFIEIITRYFPDDIVTYPEYRGKPYYSIHYLENGEEFVGYSTYNPDVLSSYLRTYFFGQKGGA